MLGFLSSSFARLPRTRPTTNRTPTRTAVVSSSAARPNSSARGIVITGATKGVGIALAEKFLRLNDTVVISSRSEDNVQDAILSLRQRLPNAQVYGYVGDVGKHEDVSKLMEFATEALDTVNAIICNAGTVGNTRAPLIEQDPDNLREVIETNLLGSIYCAREAITISKSLKQTQPIHVFLMDGSGTRGGATPGYCAYGASKRSIPQLVSSLNAESKKAGDNVCFHNLSPGMVLTDLLLKGNKDSSPIVRRVFNFLAEEPPTVADELVPRIKGIIDTEKRGTYTAFLTPAKAVYRLVTGFLLGFRRNLFFDEASGRRIDTSGKYNENGVRLRD